MKKTFGLLIAGAAVALMSSCGLLEESSRFKSDADAWNFGMDLDFLNQYADCVVLGENQSFIAISPKLQSRVMTSTLDGNDGYSMGWMNRELIASKDASISETHRNIYGGEDRLWVGPEGSDFSIFFNRGSLFVGENWQIPAAISKEPWTILARSKTQAKFEKQMSLTNIKGEKFTLKATREISFISKENIAKILEIEIPESIKTVAFQSVNKLTNKGDKTWDAQKGLLNLSVLSCFHANKTTYTFIPYNKGAAEKIGGIITDTYNEPVGGDRLSITPEYVRMRVDGTKLGEIMMNPARSKGIMGSYDSERNILTIITYLRPSAPKKYLPAKWRRANDIFDGDALALFNNGPANQGDFDAARYYESATYSPALALAPEKSQLHVQRTFHFKGSEYELGMIAQKLLGVGVKQLRPE